MGKKGRVEEGWTCELVRILRTFFLHFCCPFLGDFVTLHKMGGNFFRRKSLSVKVLQKNSCNELQCSFILLLSEKKMTPPFSK